MTQFRARVDSVNPAHVALSIFAGVPSRAGHAGDLTLRRDEAPEFIETLRDGQHPWLTMPQLRELTNWVRDRTGRTPRTLVVDEALLGEALQRIGIAVRERSPIEQDEHCEASLAAIENR